jgi:hypothetical protein
MSLLSNTLFWFRANQSLLFLLNAACLVEKQLIQILWSLVWPDQDSNPRVGVKQQPLTNQYYFIIKIGTFNINSSKKSLNVNDFNILLYDTQNTVLSSYNINIYHPFYMHYIYSLILWYRRFYDTVYSCSISSNVHPHFFLTKFTIKSHILIIEYSNVVTVAEWLDGRFERQSRF